MKYPDSEYDEKALLQLSAAGDETAFTSLFHIYKFKLYGFLLRLTDSPVLTEDLVQDIFLKLWRRRDLLDTIDHFSPYLFRMAQHHALNAFRKMARETLLPAEQLPDQGLPVTAAAEEILALKEVKHRLQEALNQLPPQQQAIYRLSREEGLSHAEIAEQLHITTGTVKNHMILALRTLRKQLNNHSTTWMGSCLLSLLALYYC